MSTSDDGFFSRWSRRKAQSRQGESLPEPVAAVTTTQPDSSGALASLASAAADPSPAALVNAQVPADAAPPPTLEEAQALTPASDFRRFVASDVSPEVRNAAVKKLFADPHFNVMDGLDIYIDDYNKPSPLDNADLAKMVSAQFLKLVDDPEAKDKNPDEAVASASPPVTEDTRAPDAAAPEEPHDDHADLQLQPDHPAGPKDPGAGAG